MTTPPRFVTDALLDEIANGAWRLATHAAWDRPPLELLAALVDPPAPSDAGGVLPRHLESRVTARFLLSETTQRLLSAAEGILRVLASGPHEDAGDMSVHGETDGRVHAGLVDWSGTLIRRLASGGQHGGVIMRRPEAQRDVPKNRLLRFLLLEIEQRAKILAQGPVSQSGDIQSRMLQLASRAAKLAHHPLLETVPASESREGHRDAARSPLAEYRAVARSFELFQGVWGSGSREILRDTLRESLSSVPAPTALAALVFLRVCQELASAADVASATVRPLAGGRGLVAILHSKQRSADVTLSKALLPDLAHADQPAPDPPSKSLPASTAVLVREAVDGVTRCRVLGVLAVSDKDSFAAAGAAHAKLLHTHARACWPELHGTSEHILVDCTAAGCGVAPSSADTTLAVAHTTRVVALAELSHAIGGVHLARS